MTKLEIINSKKESLWTMDIDTSKPLLKQIEAHGIEIPNACNIGMCWACMCMWVDWDTALNKSLRWEPAFPLWEWEIMTCIWWLEETDDTVVLQTMT